MSPLIRIINFSFFSILYRYRDKICMLIHRLNVTIGTLKYLECFIAPILSKGNRFSWEIPSSNTRDESGLSVFSFKSFGVDISSTFPPAIKSHLSHNCSHHH